MTVTDEMVEAACRAFFRWHVWDNEDQAEIRSALEAALAVSLDADALYRAGFADGAKAERERAVTVVRVSAQRVMHEDFGGGGYYRSQYAPMVERRMLAIADAIRALPLPKGPSE